ncbi:MAG: hypothetical protein BM564_09495 [Bacteroidetes bacterium MedPE-SWsnd-G2]|nr:MAG: hypothetical protein BM564_09495 [Bacteroidetes bacterium MedPE-SWsnd-G2]
MKMLSPFFLIAISTFSCDFEPSNFQNTYSDVKLFKTEVLSKENTKSLHHVVSENVWTEQELEFQPTNFNPKQLKFNQKEGARIMSLKNSYTGLFGGVRIVTENSKVTNEVSAHFLYRR